MLAGKALWAYHRKKAHMIKYPDLLYAPLEIKGDAQVHALSRCQRILTEAKKRDSHPEMKRATYGVPHGDAAGVAADFVLHVAKRMGRT